MELKLERQISSDTAKTSTEILVALVAKQEPLGDLSTLKSTTRKMTHATQSTQARKVGRSLAGERGVVVANMYGTGDKGKATKLHAEIIRSHGKCENCGGTNFVQCAHIISRRYSATRTKLNNAFALCAKCHRYYTDHPKEFGKFIDRTWAGEIYETMFQFAQSPIKMDWITELARLKRLKTQADNGTNLPKLREMEAIYE